MLAKVNAKRTGFTIVELLIVIVVIAILAAISIVAYNGIRERANNADVQAAVNQAHKQIELYAAMHDSYPSTGGLTQTRADVNCVGPVATKVADWIPNLPPNTKLPQGMGLKSGVSSRGGCFLYASDGTSYILSAWNMVSGGPQNTALYRRVGFREITLSPQAYICNHVNIGGSSSGSYNPNHDYYKHSYTISNIATCNETPPSGA